MPLKDTIGIQDQRIVGKVLYFNVKTVTYLKVDLVDYSDLSFVFSSVNSESQSSLLDIELLMAY